LVSLFLANPLIAPNLGGGGTGYRQNGLAAVVDIAAFTDPDSYRAEVDALARGLKALPRAHGVDEIHAPGERGDGLLARREAAGIPLPAGAWDRLRAEADKRGAPMPETV